MKLKLTKNIKLINRHIYRASKAIDQEKDPSEHYRNLAQMDGIEIVSMPTILKDTRTSCVGYLFKHLMQEKWDEDLSKELFGNTRNFLFNKEYDLVKEPTNEDVIAYGYGEKSPEFELMEYEVTKQAEHFGIWIDGKVISKWGPGPVFKHETNIIPTHYGDIVSFYRRKTPVKGLNERLELTTSPNL